MRSPIPWFGGKGNMIAKLLPHIPPHETYVEVFGGGAALLFAKRPHGVEVYNDIDSGLVNLFRVLRDPEKFARFQRLALLTPYSREEYMRYRELWQTAQDDVERAYMFFVVARMSFGGYYGNSWGYAVTQKRRNMAATTSRWLAVLESLPEIHRRLLSVQIEHDDFRTIFARYDTPATFFYADPPYVPETRKGGKYAHELTLADHRDLVAILLALNGKVMLSGYRHAVYEPLERAGWQRIDYPTICYAVGKTRGTGLLGEGAALARQPRVESVYLSPNMLKQEALLFHGADHDPGGEKSTK